MSTPTVGPPYLRHHWAKSDRKNPSRIHLLEHHLADVGACLEALLLQPAVRRRLARAGDMDDLDEHSIARMSVFAALHDIGKVNVGFQTQIWAPEHLQGGRQPRELRGVGHVTDLVPVLNNQDGQTLRWLMDSLGFHGGVNEHDTGLLQWADDDGSAVCGLFVAALSHHGTPLNLSLPLQSNRGAWQPFGELAPQGYAERIGGLVRDWFPLAFSPDARPLPDAPAFQHHFLGLCTLADWIGSNETWFAYLDRPDDSYIDRARAKAKQALTDIGLDISKQRIAMSAGSPDATFSNLFEIEGSPQPNAIQEQAVRGTPLNNQLVIIESETGSGKTEAALWRFAKMYQEGLVDGLYFALPTRSAASQIHGRVQGLVDRFFSEGDRPPVVLAISSYEPGINTGGVTLTEYDSQAAGHGHAGDGHQNDDDRPWASRGSKRYLAAQIAVGTVDQAMLGVLKVRHAHLRSSCLARNLLVVDEVHASDTYMTEILQALLGAHRNAGGYALLMSATLGSEARTRWLHPETRLRDLKLPALAEAMNVGYPAISSLNDSRAKLVPAGFNGQEKSVGLESSAAMANFPRTAQRALGAARAGAKVLVVRNTVEFALRTQLALEEAAKGNGDENEDRALLFTAEGITTLHHGRFARGDRQLLDGRVEAYLGRDRVPGGVIVVGTQTLEQSLDIDADLLITDLCPVDVLLQRIGRLHRHARYDRPDGYGVPPLHRPDTGGQRPVSPAEERAGRQRPGPPRLCVPQPAGAGGNPPPGGGICPMGYSRNEPGTGGTRHPRGGAGADYQGTGG